MNIEKIAVILSKIFKNGTVKIRWMPSNVEFFMNEKSILVATG